MKQYKYPISQDDYIEFRTISTEESDKFYYAVINQNNPFIEEHIFNKITNSKYNIDELNAGIIPTINYLSFTLSGFFSKQEDIIDAIEKERDNSDKSVYNKLFYSKILHYLPQYKLSDLKELTVNELLELLIIAEEIYSQKDIGVVMLKDFPKDKKFFDLARMRKALSEDQVHTKAKKDKTKNTLPTKNELDALKAILQAEEMVYD